MPDAEMTCPERCLWYDLRELYRQFRDGVLTREQGEKLKAQAIRRYDLDTGARESALRILRQNADMWAEIELAGSVYRTDRTLEHADAFIAAVYGVKVKQKKGKAMANVSEEMQEKEGQKDVLDQVQTDEAGQNNQA